MLRVGFKFAEFLSFVAEILALPFAYSEFRRNTKKERFEAALGVYREVDHIYREFTQLCFLNPQLDCYSVPQSSEGRHVLSAEDKLKQKILYDNLTDVFEAAYVHYCKFRKYTKNSNSLLVQNLFDDQWEGWVNYMWKFLKRDAYRATWKDTRDEYDSGLGEYIDALLQDPANLLKDPHPKNYPSCERPAPQRTAPRRE